MKYNEKGLKKKEKCFKKLKYKYEVLQLKYQIVAKWVPKKCGKSKFFKIHLFNPLLLF